MPISYSAYKSLGFTPNGRGVALSLKKGKISVDALLSEVKAFDSHLISLVLDPSAPLLIRPLLLPLKSVSEVDQALPHEVEGLFSTQGEIAFDRIIHPMEKGKRRTILLMTPQTSLEETYKPYEELGIQSEVITAAPVCLANAAQHIAPSSVPRGVLLVDDDFPLFIIEKEGALLGSTKLSLPLQKGGLARAIGSLTRELGLPISKEILSFSFGQTVEAPSPYQLVPPPNVFGFTEEDWPLYVLPFGAAVGSLVGNHLGINLRERLHSPALPWKRTRSTLFTVSAAFALALFALTLAGNAYISWKADLLKEKWAATLSLLGKSDTALEETFIEKKGGIPTPLSHLSPEDIILRAEFVQKELAATPILFPLHPNVPRFTDFLAWLSSLNEVTGEDGRLQMTSLQYTLVKRPEMERKQEKYQVKVDLEFTTTSPKWAREFHDLLISPNPFVDPKGEVKWNVARGSYKTSFLLKDHTAYVH